MANEKSVVFPWWVKVLLVWHILMITYIPVQLIRVALLLQVIMGEGS